MHAVLPGMSVRRNQQNRGVIMVTRVVISGVGGQGILLASDILSDVCMKTGMDVKKSEVHGMSQRGGDVVSHVVFGEKVYSPLISYKEADVILSFEKVEALRNIDYLKDDGVMIINDMTLFPLPVACGMADYPEDPVGEIRKHVKKGILIDGEKMATELGNIRVMNVILLGLLAKHVGIDKQVFIDVIKEKVPPKTVEINLKAFDLGYNYEG